MKSGTRRNILDAAVSIGVATAVVLGYTLLARPAALAPGGEIDAQLGRVIDLVYFQKADLETAARFVGDQMGSAVEVDWAGLASARAMTKGSITILWERDMPVWRLLDEIVMQTEMRPLEWRVERGRVVIGPAPNAMPPLTLRYYEVQDLMEEAMERHVEVQRALAVGQSAGSAPAGRAAIEAAVMNDMMTMVGMELAATPTAPTRWTARPPAMGSWPGWLVARVPDAHHRRIEDLLEILRQGQRRRE